jgi:hypothetical protein
LLLRGSLLARTVRNLRHHAASSPELACQAVLGAHIPMPTQGQPRLDNGRILPKGTSENFREQRTFTNNVRGFTANEYEHP